MFIAVREIRRAVLRFAFLSGAVGLLVFVLLFFQAVSAGLLGSLTGAIARQSAEVLVFGELARGAVDASVIPEGAEAAVREVAGVGELAPLGQSTFTARVDGALDDVVLFGVAMQGPGAPPQPAEGTLPTADDEVLASALGSSAGLGVGDEVVLEPGGRALRVVGTVEDAAYNALPTLYATPSGWQGAVLDRTPGLPQAPASLLAVTPTDGAAPEDVAARITAEVEGVEAMTRELAVDGLPGIDQIGQSFGILYALLLVVVGLVTGVFFLILTVQKRESLVLLRAIGARRRDVILPVLLQVVVVVGVGVTLAVALAVPTVGAVGGALGARLDPLTVALTSVAVVVLGLLAASAAVRRLLAIEPIEATTSGGLG